MGGEAAGAGRVGDACGRVEGDGRCGLWPTVSGGHAGEVSTVEPNTAPTSASGLVAERYDQAMRRALALAAQAARAGEVPVGALVLGPDDTVLAEAANSREAEHDPTAHAELRALRAAGAALGDSHLDGCTLVVNLEPCTMCAGALVLARVARVVFGAWEPRTGACGSVRDVLRDPRANHQVEVLSGVRASQSEGLLREFFGRRR